MHKFIEVKSYTVDRALEESVEGIMTRGASVVSTSTRLPPICASSHYLMATRQKLCSFLAPTYHLYVANRFCRLLQLGS